MPNIWAIGDVSNRVPLTPAARMEGSALANALFGCATCSGWHDEGCNACTCAHFSVHVSKHCCPHLPYCSAMLEQL